MHTLLLITLLVTTGPYYVGDQEVEQRVRQRVGQQVRSPKSLQKICT